MEQLDLLGCRDHQRLGEPGIEVNRQMRALLLGTSERDHRDDVTSGQWMDLFIGEVAVSDADIHIGSVGPEPPDCSTCNATLHRSRILMRGGRRTSLNFWLPTVGSRLTCDH